MNKIITFLAGSVIIFFSLFAVAIVVMAVKDIKNYPKCDKQCAPYKGTPYGEKCICDLKRIVK